MLGSNYTLGEIAEILFAKVEGDKSLAKSVVSQVATDSRYRSIDENTLFFALKSEGNDGHKYIDHAYAKGVRMFVVNRNEYQDFDKNAVYLVTEDPLKALQSLAAFHRKKFSYPILAITGSNGKTVVKEWFYQISSNLKHVVRSPKSYNSQIGVPLSILMMPLDADLGIVEAGISKVGEMKKLKHIIQPDVGLVTNIHNAHLENFNHSLELAKEKISLFENCPIIYNKDYADIMQALSQSDRIDSEQDLCWSENDEEKADVHVTIKKEETSSKITIEGKGDNKEITLPFSDDASIENAIHCVILTQHFHLSWNEVQGKFSHLPSIAMRLEQLAGINNCTIINDSYNSDLTSLEIALRFLNMQNQHPKKTLIISDIIQSGIVREQLYKRVNELCVSNDIDRVVGIGEAIQKSAECFEMPFVAFKSTKSFLDSINELNFYNESILLKGARIFGFEDISSVLQYKKHETTLEVNLSAVNDNLNFFKSNIDPATKIMVMVKAFSYGAGSFEIANVLQHHGVDYLAVAFIDEGITLRNKGIKLPIMIMNASMGELEHMVKYELEPEIFSVASMRILNSYTKNSGHEIKIHLKVESGMHRLGIEEHDLPEMIELLKQNKKIKVRSVFSHMAASDDPKEDKFTKEQYEKLEFFVKTFKNELGIDFISHLVNSDGIYRFPEMHLDMVRLGIGLYGVSTISEVREKLRSVVSLRTIVSQVKKVKKGESVGYSRVFKAENDILTAIIPIGYADGIDRSLGNRNWNCTINREIAPIIGNVCMDMCMLDVSLVPGVKEGDEVIVLGPENDVYKMAEQKHTIPYEILTSFSERIKRVFYYGD